MDGIIGKFVLLALFSTQFALAVETSASVEQMVERINRRHDDFFRYHRDMEERWEKLRIGANERRKQEKIYYEKLEKARQQYIANRKAKASDEALRIKWERQQKEHQDEIEMLRRRYVQKRDTIEQYLKKGRAIPEMKEYDLEGI